MQNCDTIQIVKLIRNLHVSSLWSSTLILARWPLTFQYMLISRIRTWRFLIYHILIKHILPDKLPKDLIVTVIHVVGRPTIQNTNSGITTPLTMYYWKWLNVIHLTQYMLREQGGTGENACLVLRLPLKQKDTSSIPRTQTRNDAYDGRACSSQR